MAPGQCYIAPPALQEHSLEPSPAGRYRKLRLTPFSPIKKDLVRYSCLFHWTTYRMECACKNPLKQQNWNKNKK